MKLYLIPRFLLSYISIVHQHGLSIMSKNHFHVIITNIRRQFIVICVCGYILAPYFDDEKLIKSIAYDHGWHKIKGLKNGWICHHCSGRGFALSIENHSIITVQTDVLGMNGRKMLSNQKTKRLKPWLNPMTKKMTRIKNI